MTPEERQVEREIWIALERLVTRMENFFAARQAAQKYRADQARWPAGSSGGVGGQFAPENGGAAHGNYLRGGRRPVQLAFAGDDAQLAQARSGGRRGPTARPWEDLDPLSPVRAALYESGLRTLRQLEPNNPLLTYLSVPGSAPSNEALNRLHTELRDAVIRRFSDFVMPGGVPLGDRRGGDDILGRSGGMTAAQDAFDYLRVGGTADTRTSYPGTLIRLPGGAGTVGLRTTSSSDSPAVDITIPEIPFRTLHYRK